MHQATISIDSLAADAEVIRLTAREGLSELFDVRAEFWCDAPDLDPAALLWKATWVAITRDDEVPRVFHGVIEEVESIAARGDRARFRVRLRPRIHGLAHRVRSRIFQSMSAVEVIERVLRDAGVPGDALDAAGLAGSYPVREYCVQYRESELDFVLRLLEDEGIFYWFRHTSEGHVMVLGDAADVHEPIDPPSTLVYSRTEHGAREHVTDLVFTARAATGRVIANDWNFLDASHVLEAEFQEQGAQGFVHHAWPGGFTEVGDGTRRAEQRMHAAQARRRVVTGRSNCLRLEPGRIITVSGVRPARLGGDQLLLSVEHRFVQDAVVRADGSAQPYEARYECVASDVPFRPTRATPRPRIAGVESAVITGPPGEEIHVDAWGRVKVHFNWDREGAVDDTATCWVRVQQQNTSGAMILPRVGWEVSVGFLDGDPDRPVVLQKLYNAEQMPPYAQPDNKTQGALQSATYPGGGATNEIRLQDGNGGMEFFVHASRNLDVHAGHNLAETVAVNESRDVGLTLRNTVGGSQSVSVGGSRAVSVTGTSGHDTTGDRSLTVGGAETVGVAGAYSVTSDGARSESIGGAMTVLACTVVENVTGSQTRTVGAAQAINSAEAVIENVTGACNSTIGGAHLVVARKSFAETIGAAKTLAVGGAVLLKAGADINVAAKGAITYSSAGTITEKCGDGWSVTARNVLITAPGVLHLKGGGSQLKLSGGTMKYNAGSLSIVGTAQVVLKGTINYK